MQWFTKNLLAKPRPQCAAPRMCQIELNPTGSLLKCRMIILLPLHGFRGLLCIAIQFVTRNCSVRSGLLNSLLMNKDTSVSICSVLQHLAFWPDARRGGKFNPRYGNTRCDEFLLAHLISSSHMTTGF